MLKKQWKWINGIKIYIPYIEDFIPYIEDEEAKKYLMEKIS